MTGDVPLLRIEGFTGSDERWDTRPDSAVKLENVRWDPRGGWERAPGMGEMVDKKTPFIGDGEIRSMHWWSQHNGGPQFLVYEQGEYLRYFNGATKSYVTLASGRYQTGQPWQRTQYFSMGNNLWILNGEDAPLRFDGRNIWKAGFDGPAPSVTAAGYADGFTWGTTNKGLGLGTAMSFGINGNGEYGCLITEVNSFGTESPPSPGYVAVKWTQEAPTNVAGNPIKVADPASGDVVIQPKYFIDLRVPHSGHIDVIERRYYRTQNCASLGLQQGASFYLAAVIKGYGSHPHVDGLPDQYLGPEFIPSSRGPWPRGAKYGAVYKNTVFLAGMPDSPGMLRYSSPADPENFPASNYHMIGDADSGEITGLREFRNCLVVFKRRGVFLVTGDQVQGFIVQTITKGTGCASANTIREIPSMGGSVPQLMFASEDGVHVLTGSLQVTDTPAAVQTAAIGLADFFKWRVNHAAMANAWAEVDLRGREYLLSLPIGGDQDNAMVLAYSYDQNVWSFRPGLAVACMAATHDHRRYLFMGSNDDTNHPGIFVYTPGEATIDGTAITARIETAQWDLGGVYEHVYPTDLLMRILEYGTGTITAHVYKDRRPTELTVGGQTRQQQDQEYLSNPPPVWGTATWTTDENWTRARPTVVAINVVNGTGAKEYQVVLESSARVQFLGLLLKGQPSNVIEVPAANAILGTGTVE